MPEPTNCPMCGSEDVDVVVTDAGSETYTVDCGDCGMSTEVKVLA